MAFEYISNDRIKQIWESNKHHVQVECFEGFPTNKALVEMTLEDFHTLDKYFTQLKTDRNVELDERVYLELGSFGQLGDR